MKLETEVKRGDVSSVLELIAKFSHATWAKLPANTKVYMSVEDLIAYGTNYAVTYVVKSYRGRKHKAQFITFLYIALENLYKDVVKEAYTDKRAGLVFSADTQVQLGGRTMSLFDALSITRRHSNEDLIIHRIDAEKAFLKVYEAASPKLRKHLINWCIQPTSTKYILSGNKFVAARREFRSTGFDKILTPDLIRTIQQDAVCRFRVVLSIIKNGKCRTIRRRQYLERLLLPVLEGTDEYEYSDIALS